MKRLFNPGIEGSGYLRYEPLSLRAWSIQERMLSKGTLFFGCDRTIWACGRCTVSEDDIEGARLDQGLSELREDNAYYQWGRISSQYTDCKLTHESDRLPALAGVARKVADLVQDNYIAGHWEQDLLSSICWWTPEVAGVKNPVPSWSWASVKCGIMRQRTEHAEPQSITKLVLPCVSPAGVDPFGAVAPGGHLVLLGPVFDAVLTSTCKLLYDYSWGGKQSSRLTLSTQRLEAKVWIDNPSQLGAKDPQSSEECEASVKILVTSRRPSASQSIEDLSAWIVCGLFIESAEDHGTDAFRRVGTFECEHSMDLPGSCFREIRLY